MASKKPFSETAFRAWAARWNAKRHLRAYVVDTNPWHIVDACQEFRRVRHQIPPVLLDALFDRAIPRIRLGRPTRKQPKNIVDDLELLRTVERMRAEEMALAPRDRRKLAPLLTRVGAGRGLSQGALKMRLRQIRNLDEWALRESWHPGRRRRHK